MTEFTPSRFFDLEHWDLGHRLLLEDDPVWSCLGDRLRGFFDDQERWHPVRELPPGVHVLGDRIRIGRGVRIEPGAVLVGPAILEDGVSVRTGAYIREHVVLGAGSLVGAHSEVKGSILLPGAKAPHQAYVGDSILGRDVKGLANIG